jgi:hypothetical protein
MIAGDDSGTIFIVNTKDFSIEYSDKSHDIVFLLFLILDLFICWIPSK